MDKDTRNAIERATQRARKLLEEDFAAQLEGDFDVHRDGTVAAKAGKHLSARGAFQRERIVAAIEHKRAAGMNAPDAARDYLRDAAFTTLNRFVALKMLEARDLVQECISKGEQSAGYREFCGMAPGLPLLPDSAGYRLYIESLFDELSTEVKVLFDRRDPSSVLWPKRATFEQLLEILNATELARVWGEDETIGWVYQFFNGQDERKKMREESQAPRNSRELAVRNQFFTPRYVVQFLTDNTLGRIWYEMRGTKTALAEKCEYMVRKPGEEFPPRAKKDPRDLRVLDPACGSGHFLLYAFDLLLTIYEEAFADAESPKSEATGKTLAQDYSSLDALRRAIPGLVLAHNLHGVDIDPRCAQIAQLALWMRAQKAYRDFSIGRGDRAQIRRSNIVVAEPLVADAQIAKEFVAKLGDAELGRVFTSLVESLSLAGDLGLLLRVEQLVVRQPKRGQTGDLFAPPEERIRAALDRFVREEASTTNTRRRLFADDAAHGVALLSVAEKKFDTVLMNPPFGAGSTRAKQEFERAYQRTKNDVYAAFIERGMELLALRGRVGAITSGTYFNLSTFGDLRSLLLSDWASKYFVDLGPGVMDDAAVSAACAVVENDHPADDAELLFVDMRFAAERGEALKAALADNSSYALSRLTVQVLRRLPDEMFGYWLPSRVHRLFSELPSLGQQAVATFGLHCRGADERFYRAWWEVDSSELVPSVWPAVFLGGTPQHFFRDTYYIVNWRDQARMLREVASHASGGTFTGRDHYFRPGLTYIYTAQTTFSVQPLPEGCVFTAAAHGLFPDRSSRAAWLAWLNSEAVRLLTKVINPNRFFQASYVRLIPVPEFGERARALETLSQRAIALSIEYVGGDECSRHYRGDWASTNASPGGNPFELARTRAETIAAELRGLEWEVNALVEGAYGLSEDDLSVMSARIGASTAQALPGSIDIAAGGEPAVAREHCSAMIGAALGRWDSNRFARFEGATGFDPFAAVPSPVPLRIPSRTEGILVDDEGHQHDIVAQVEAQLSTRWRSDYWIVAARLAELLGSELRQWVRREFWAYHLGRYSFSQATAPIYWQLATPSASYSVWLYIHAFSTDTLFRVQNDYVTPKLAHEERRLESLTSELRDGATAAQRKQLAAQETLVEELRAFLDEVKRVAPLWNPNLDDGVIINFAPLWRLVPQNKSWQKELKSTWDALCDGKYDWAHLAMHLWPERVVPKCATDRSLAIAHGLEEVFWVEGAEGKWTARKTPTRSVDELVKERTSAAVKSALKSLLDAPVASGAAKKSKKGKANA